MNVARNVITVVVVILVLTTQPLLAAVDRMPQERITYESSCGDKHLTVWQSGRVSYDSPTGRLEFTITKDGIRGGDFEIRFDGARDRNGFDGQITARFRDHVASTGVRGDRDGHMEATDVGALQSVISEFSGSEDARLLREAATLVAERGKEAGSDTSWHSEQLLQPTYNFWDCASAVGVALVCVTAIGETCVAGPNPACIGSVVAYAGALNQIANDCNFYN